MHLDVVVFNQAVKITSACKANEALFGVAAVSCKLPIAEFKVDLRKLLMLVD